MSAYIGVTSREWFTYLAAENWQGEVNFWKKKTTPLRRLSTGDPFFFLVKNDKAVKGERFVMGVALFERFEVLTVAQAWDSYKEGNGDPSSVNFYKRMQEMFGEIKDHETIGCLILSSMQVFEKPVLLSAIGIDFKNAIVSGRYAEEWESLEILKNGRSLKGGFIKEKENEYGNKYDQVFPEGQTLFEAHLRRERNSRVIQLAKQRYFEKHGDFSCEVCSFNFGNVYGEVGEGYIEGHHTKPISEMKENDVTRIEDIALVCANCHRMLHRRRPWLTMKEIRQLLKV